MDEEILTDFFDKMGECLAVSGLNKSNPVGICTTIPNS